MKKIALIIAIVPLLLIACPSGDGGIGTGDDSGDDGNGGDGANPPPSSMVLGVTDVSVTYGSEMVILRWSNPTSDDFSHIEISWGDDSRLLTPAESGAAGAQHVYTITDLTNNTSYIFTIVVIDTNGDKSDGVSSAAITPQSADVDVPAAVSGVSFVYANQAAILHWTNPLDDDFSHVAISWIDSKDASADSTTDILDSIESGAQGAESTYMVGPFTVSSYIFTITAVDTSNNQSLGIKTARYVITFDANWSQAQNGGTDFPTGNPHFTLMAMVAHNSDVTFWNSGVLASNGIEQVAELGDIYTFRDNEVKNAMDAGNALSFTFTEAISVDNMGGITGSRSAVMYLNSEFPLLTTASMLAPSPDWFVGVHDISILDGDQNFITSMTIDLRPYDAGTESGDGFSLNNPAEQTNQPIAFLAGSSTIGFQAGKENVAQLIVEIQ